jgi:hypothetical protein
MKKLIRRLNALLKRILKKYSSNSQQPLPLINTRPLDTSLPTVAVQWESGLVLVCSQCGNEQSGSTASADLENWLKSRLKFEGLWGEFRVVSTSCLGVCPKSGITVVVVSNATGGKSPCLIINPQSDRQLLYSYIKHNKG